MVSARISCSVSHAPPFKSIAAKRERSSALEKSPAFPETPPSRAALSSCTSPRSQRCRNTVSCSVGAIQSRDEAGGKNRVAGMPSGPNTRRADVDAEVEVLDGQRLRRVLVQQGAYAL